MDIKAQFNKYYTPTRGHVAVGVVGLLAGAGIGYVAGKRRKLDRDAVVEAFNEEVSAQLRLDFANAAAEQDTVEVVKQAVVQEIVSDPPAVVASRSDGPLNVSIWERANDGVQAAAQKAKAIVKEEGYDPGTQRNWEDEWDQDEENENRSPDAPYVISKREFHEGASPHRQTSLEYFAGDDILCDEHRVPISDHVKIAGRLEFGRGTDDPDVVYVRNEKLDSEFEITRNPGTYAAEVLGLEAEEDADREDDQLRHSIPRFRRD